MAMSCEDIRRRLLDRDWDRAALEDAVSLAAHMAGCPACQEAADEYDQLRRLLRITEPVPGEVTGVRSTGFSRNSAERPPKGVTTNSLFQATNIMTARWAWAAALAVSLVVGIAGWALYLSPPRGAGQVAQPGPAPGGGTPRHTVPLPNGPDEPPPQVMQWTAADIERGVAVFTNVSQTFQGRTSWVAVGDRAADLGLMPAPAIPQHKVVLLRLVISHDGHQRSRTDLVIVPGQEASLDVPFEAGVVLRYHIATTADADRRLSLWAELRKPSGDGETLAALATQLKPVPGQMLSAGRLVTSSGGYNLEVSFQEKDLSGAKP
jgi:hypothetical protein